MKSQMHVKMIYGPILRSSDKDCILMYPLVPWYISEDDVALSKILARVDRKVFNDPSRKDSNLGANENFSRNQIATEMSAALGISKALRDSLFVFDDYVTSVSGKTVREMLNADAVHFYDIPLEEPYMDNYVHCTGMLVSKCGRAAMIFKWFFTEDGKKSEFEYLKLLAGNIWYDKWEKPESRFNKADK